MLFGSGLVAGLDNKWLMNKDNHISFSITCIDYLFYFRYNANNRKVRNNMDFINSLEEIDIIIYIIKTFFISIFSYITSVKKII